MFPPWPSLWNVARFAHLVSQAPDLRNVSRIKLSADRIDLTNRELLQLDREESNQRSKPLFRSEFGKTESTQGNFHPL